MRRKPIDYYIPVLIVLVFALTLLIFPSWKKLIEHTSSSSEVPKRFDWRDVNGEDYTTPAISQGRLSAAGPFAEIGVVEALYKIRHKSPRAHIKLSEQFMLSCMADYDGGETPPDTVKIDEAWKTMGIVDYACFPYIPRDTLEKIPCRPCDDWQKRIVAKIVRKIEIPPGDANLKRALVRYGPLVVGMDLYEDALNYSGGIYRHATGNYVGGHVVMLAGFDDEKEFWVVRNSGPKGWGENGFMRIAYYQCALGRNPYALEVQFFK